MDTKLAPRARRRPGSGRRCRPTSLPQPPTVLATWVPWPISSCRAIGTARLGVVVPLLVADAAGVLDLAEREVQAGGDPVPEVGVGREDPRVEHGDGHAGAGHAGALGPRRWRPRRRCSPRACPCRVAWSMPLEAYRSSCSRRWGATATMRGSVAPRALDDGPRRGHGDRPDRRQLQAADDPELVQQVQGTVGHRPRRGRRRRRGPGRPRPPAGPARRSWWGWRSWSPCPGPRGRSAAGRTWTGVSRRRPKDTTSVRASISEGFRELPHASRPILRPCAGRYSSLSRLAVSTADRAASAPLLPSLPPARSTAWSHVSVVRTPKATGMPVSRATAAAPLADSPAT